MRRLIFIIGSVSLLVPVTGCSSQTDDHAASPSRKTAPTAVSTDLPTRDSIEQRLKKATQLVRNRQFGEAILQLQKVLVAVPDHPEATFLLAQCEANQGRYTEAIELLDRIERSETGYFADAAWFAADLLTKLQRFDEAVERLESLSEVRPSIPLHRLLAMLLNQLGRRREAGLHLFELAKAGNISEEELFQMNSYNQPIIGHDGLKLDEAGSLTSEALNEAKRERIEGDLSRSRRLAQRLADQFPKSAAIVAFYGQTLADTEDDQGLSLWLSHLPAGIEREPEYWYALGKWLENQGQYEHAVRCYLENVSIDSTDRNAYRSLAHSLRSLGRESEAKAVTQRYELLQDVYMRTSKLGLEIGTIHDIEKLARKLELLQRPFEAIAWRKAGTQGRGGDPAELVTLERRRIALTEQQTAPDLQFVTCGLRTSDWPLPDLNKNIGSGMLSQTEDPIQPNSPLRLIDVASKCDLNFRYNNGDQPGDSNWYIYQLSGGGIGVIDFDLDGWPDLYFSQAGGKPWSPDGSLPNQLFRNFNGGKFAPVSEASATDDRGCGQGVAVADINQDGFQDLLVANIGINVILINQGDGSFLKRLMPTSNSTGDWTTSIACGDLSGDHLPEIVEVNYIDDVNAYTKRCEPNNQNCNPAVYRSALSRVWSINESGQAVAWAGCQGMAETRAFGFAAIISDLDSRPGNDLFIANDTVENFLWCKLQSTSDSNNVLQECARLAGCAVGWLGQRQGSMGIALGDFDHDGRPDLHVTNYWNQPADLFLQKSDSLFTNATMGFGLYEPTRLTVGWGTQAVDFDRDGWLDLAVLNGHVLDRRQVGIPLEMKAQLFQGSKGRFDLIKNESTEGEYWSKPLQGRSLATVDYNRDGKPDLVAAHLDAPAALLENQTDSQHFIRFQLIGVSSERDAIGAKVSVSAGEQSWTGWVTGGDGFACSNESIVDVGVGNVQQIDKIEVLWPSGHRQAMSGLRTDETYLLIENESEAIPLFMQSRS